MDTKIKYYLYLDNYVFANWAQHCIYRCMLDNLWYNIVKLTRIHTYIYMYANTYIYVYLFLMYSRVYTHTSVCVHTIMGGSILGRENPALKTAAAGKGSGKQ